MAKIYIGADHAGFELKEKLKKYLEKKKINCEDLSPKFIEGDDYPDIAFKVGEKVAKEKGKGILVCGSGEGVVIAANKVKGVRAVAPYDSYSAKMSRVDNDSNVISLSGRHMSSWKARRILNEWLNTEFSNEERHKRRLKKIADFEK